MRFLSKNSAYYNVISRIACEEHDNDLNWMVKEKLNHLEQNAYTSREVAFLAKLVYSEIFIRFADLNNKSIHATIKQVAKQFRETGFPFNYTDINSEFLIKLNLQEKHLKFLEQFDWDRLLWGNKRDFKIFEAKLMRIEDPYDNLPLQKRMLLIRNDQRKEPKFEDVEHLRKNAISKQQDIIDFWVSRIPDDAYFLKVHICSRLNSVAQTRLKGLDQRIIEKRLLKWMNEHNVPNSYEVERGKSIYTVNEIASINRNEENSGYILSKKEIREQIKKKPQFMKKFVEKMLS